MTGVDMQRDKTVKEEKIENVKIFDFTSRELFFCVTSA